MGIYQTNALCQNGHFRHTSPMRSFYPNKMHFAKMVTLDMHMGLLSKQNVFCQMVFAGFYWKLNVLCHIVSDRLRQIPHVLCPSWLPLKTSCTFTIKMLIRASIGDYAHPKWSLQASIEHYMCYAKWPSSAYIQNYVYMYFNNVHSFLGFHTRLHSQMIITGFHTTMQMTIIGFHPKLCVHVLQKCLF